MWQFRKCKDYPLHELAVLKCYKSVKRCSPLLQAEIEEAARLANAHGFISALPNGYATQVCMPGSSHTPAPAFHASEGSMVFATPHQER